MKIYHTDDQRLVQPRDGPDIVFACLLPGKKEDAGAQRAPW